MYVCVNRQIEQAIRHEQTSMEGMQESVVGMPRVLRHTWIYVSNCM